MFCLSLNFKMHSSNKFARKFPLFECIQPTNKIVGVKPLLRKLLFQMYNYVKNNKNRHLLAFLSLLITHKVFEEVQLGFFVIMHTPEDIDGSFGYLLKKLRK